MPTHSVFRGRARRTTLTTRLLMAGAAVLAATALVAAFTGNVNAAGQRDPEDPHRHEKRAGADQTVIAAAEPTLNRAGWTATASSQQGFYPASNVLDGNTNTFWHTQYSPSVTPLPHTITIDMNNSNTVSGLRYLPRADSANGRIGAYQLHVSTSAGGQWALVASGTFADSPAEKTVPINPTNARYVRLTALSEAGNRGQWSSGAEINITGTPAPTLNRAGWTAAADSQQGPYPASNVLDGNNSTFWHTQYSPSVTPLPHTITLNMQKANVISGLRYLPRADSPNGRIGQYQIHVSPDNVTYTLVASGSFGDTAGEKTVPFTPATAQFVRLTALTEAGNRGQWSSGAEINITGVAAPTLPRVGWTAAASTQQGAYPASKAIDGVDASFWHSQYSPSMPPFPHAITIDMKTANVVSGLRYLPRADSANGRIGGYQVHISTDNVTYTLVASGAFPDTAAEKNVSFNPISARFVKLTSLSEAGNRGALTSAAEINLIGVPPSQSAAASGAWGETIGFPLIPVAAAVLPGNKMLAWSALTDFDYNPLGQGITQTATVNLATGTVTKASVSNTGHDMFCPGLTTLADGRIFVNGGSNAAQTSIYNPATGTWAASNAMNIPRGYQSSVTLSDGRVFTLGGSWSGSMTTLKNGEIWSASSGWKTLSGVPVNPILTNDPQGMYRADNHGWFFAAPGGRVFHAGPSKQMTWIDPNANGGNGSISPAGNRNDDGDAMNGNAVMYDIGRILTLGGSPAYQNPSANDNTYLATKNAYVIDINGGGTPVVSKTGSMAHARSMHNSVVLPDGKVLTIGGQSKPVVWSENDSQMAPELWDPVTGTWTELAAMSPVPRVYHSVTVLLPDGRVFAGGGGLCGNCYGNPALNHADGQIFSPPYLFGPDGKPAPRPAITSTPGVFAPGATITVSTDRPVSAFSLVRMSTATHSINTDQRRVPLVASAVNGTSYTLPVPADRGVVVPGNYMLFAMDANGVPSVAATVKIS